MSDDTRQVPFTYSRSVFWADTDTARIVYTGRFIDFMFEAIESWMRAYLDTDWFRQTVDEKRGGPIAHLELDFFARVSPRDRLDMRVYLERVGGSSVTFRVEGFVDGDAHAFTGRCVSVGFDYEARQSMAIPPARRQIMEDYQKACEEAAQS